jgi:hypothetical protein
MKLFEGLVSQLRQSTIVTTSNNGSRTRHTTAFKFGDHFMSSTTSSLPAISNGDQVRAVGFTFNGTVHPVLWRNLSTGYRGGFAFLPAIIAGFIGGCAFAYAGVQMPSVGLTMFGASFAVFSVFVGYLRARAANLLDSADSL